ncbi:hypothetical protein TraAM80_05483 [Trypanosoma rangeli]|uniref:Uncharacterized protein n=1 Tax=Trypanosoma rangeli TaxID=5698 RepID=A0A422NEK5_TRYRA|nr:uncharacterized protein TraAM80_05483 [Trypanosoma rangeli]RNF03887.1 hypothetical protein TraAM80_05483 [Trypanosoma rangeli]|eukprot:RNF03887.1 hypothetical protein TraAM80_05483 [Trypanosoma rangeli]
MDARALTQIVENADAATLQTYIQDGCSPFSQPLGAQARFAYFHLLREDGARAASGVSAAVGGERRSASLFEEYHGPATTYVMRPQGKEKALKSPTLPPRPLSLVDRAPCRRPNLSALAWVIQSNGWTENVLRHSSARHSLNALHDAWHHQWKPSSRVSLHSCGGLTTAPRSVVSSARSGASEIEDPGWQHRHQIQECESKRFREALQRLEMEERRERSKMETTFEEFLVDRRRWRHSHLDCYVKEKSALLTAESIVRSTITREENCHYREILTRCLGDLTGCRWDGVRVQWLRKQMANSMMMHEWVELSSPLPRWQRSGQDIALGTGDCTWKVGELQGGSPSVWLVNAGHCLSTPLCESPLPHDADPLAKTGETPPQAVCSTAILPSQPRVLPHVVPHEECTMS